MQSTYSLQEPFIREINDCPPSLSNFCLIRITTRLVINSLYIFLESLLELIIAKDSLKSNSPSIDQILSHSFFKEFASSFDQTYAESLHPSKTSFVLTSKDALLKASQKSEQRLKDEQKLVNYLNGF